MTLRVVFMGTPDFAIPTVEALIESRHDLVAVVCQPDKPKGRGQKLKPPPVKMVAQTKNIVCYQPKSIKKKKFKAWLHEIAPDLIVVAAYGKIVPPHVLEFPKYGCINVHASLLPKYRGAAPINWAIINGEVETGITIMQMDETMDTGAILYQESVPIASMDTAETLFKTLAPLGAQCLMKTLDLLEAGQLNPIGQDHTKATYAPLLKKEFGHMDWSLSAKALFDKVRGMYPWPGNRTVLNGLEMKLFPFLKYTDTHHETLPGSILWIGQESLEVACGTGSVHVIELQPANRKRMSVQGFLQGYSIKIGDTFESKSISS